MTPEEKLQKLQSFDNYCNDLSDKEWEKINEGYTKEEARVKANLDAIEKEQKERFEKSSKTNPCEFTLDDTTYVKYGVYNHTIKQMVPLHGVCFVGVGAPVWFDSIEKAENVLKMMKKRYPHDDVLTIISKTVTEKYTDICTTYEDVVKREG